MKRKRALAMKKRTSIVLAILSLVLATMACSIWVGDRKIVGEDLPIANTPTQVLATKAPLPTLLPTLPPSPTLTAQVTALQSLNVRKRAGEDQTVAGYVFSGDSVILTGNCEQGWAEIVWGDGTAWVNADYLSENKCSE